jgi:hypothetical protein
VLSDKDPAEIVTITFDFAQLLTRIDSVVSVSVLVHKGVDANPAVMLLNAPIISDTHVLQLVQGGLDGVYYKVRADAQVGSERYALSAILPVRAQ